MKNWLQFLGLVASTSPVFAQDPIQEFLNRQLKSGKIEGISIAYHKAGKSKEYSAGNLNNGNPFFIASTTKLFSTALIFRLVDQGKISLNEPLSKYLDKSLVQGIHSYKGQNYSDSIKVFHLLEQSSGLPDYFSDKGPDGKTMVERLRKSDFGWTCEDAIQRTRTMKALFEPGRKGKAHYSDANYQLLGALIRKMYGKSTADAIRDEICIPLKLNQTYLFELNTKPGRWFLDGKDSLVIPLAMASTDADGGIVSTSTDLLRFVHAFFGGDLFDKRHVATNQEYRSIFFPLAYGRGFMKFELPAALTLFKKYPAFYGHSGLSGAFAWYIPEKDLFVAGTVNQLKDPGLSFNLLIKMLPLLK
ncbi:MAG: beta-lactamase family protein [Bacteroidetes bacterium]|nr:beta-lactamase family protein [Bacteroidota bacterium]